MGSWCGFATCAPCATPSLCPDCLLAPLCPQPETSVGIHSPRMRVWGAVRHYRGSGGHLFPCPCVPPGMPIGYVPPTAPAVDSNHSLPREAASRPPGPAGSQAPGTAGISPPPASPTAPREPGPEAGESLSPQENGDLPAASSPLASPRHPFSLLKDCLIRARAKGGGENRALRLEGSVLS